MFAPVVRKTVLVGMMIILSACAKDGGGGNGNGGGKGNPDPIVVDTKLRLKNASIKKVQIGGEVDLRLHLLNYTHAAYEIAEGAAGVVWIEPSIPKLKFNHLGKVLVVVIDEQDGTRVELEFLVRPVLGLEEGPGIIEPDPLPVDPGLGGLL